MIVIEAERIDTSLSMLVFMYDLKSMISLKDSLADMYEMNFREQDGKHFVS